jgi:hypothetical protein
MGERMEANATELVCVSPEDIVVKAGADHRVQSAVPAFQWA